MNCIRACPIIPLGKRHERNTNSEAVEGADLFTIKNGLTSDFDLQAII